MQSRRNWLKKALLMSAAWPAGATLAEQLIAAPVSPSEQRFRRDYPAPSVRIRLNANENPYGPSEKAKKAVTEYLIDGNRYPFPAANDFKKMLAEHEGVTPDHILIGAGSSDLLCATACAYSVDSGSILSPFPTFPMLMNYAEVYSARWDRVDVDDRLVTDYTAVASAISPDTRLVYICNPNNPTGTLVDPKVVLGFCEEVSSKVPVFADEAYLEFLEPSQQLSAVKLVREGKNVIVSRTFSKIYGLAGMRIGYIVARPDTAKKIARHHPGIPINQAGLAAARAVLNDQAFMALVRKKNAEARKHLTDYLDRHKYFYGKSETNFVMFDPRTDGYAIMKQLSEKGIGIRVWDFQGKAWCRVSIGTLAEMKTFTQAFDAIKT